MKKLFLGLLAGVAMLFTACQDEEVKAVVDGDTTVSITAQLPTGVSTRAYADGTTATKLTYAIYETGQITPLITGNAIFDDLKTTVNVRLVNGKTYDMLFWAQADGAPYTFNTATKEVTVDYEAAVGQDEKRDAFFKAERLTVDGTIDKTIQLKRPFAQLNIGAQDFEDAKKAGFEATQTTVTVDNVYTTLNLLTGAVEDETSVTYAAANLPTEGFPVSLTPAAKYMSMDYLLVAADKALTNVTFTATNGSHNVERHYTNVPVQRNFRTNIYGNILTEDANFNIEIVPGFENPDYNFKVVEVATAADLATAVAAGGAVKLTADIDLSNTLAVAEGKELTVNLNGHTLNLGAYSLDSYVGTINCYGGKITAVTSPVQTSSINIGETGTMNFDNVEFETNASLFFVKKTANLKISNSNLKAAVYCVTTNATDPAQNPTIVLENSTFEGSTPILVNIPCQLTITGCTTNASMHGLVVRGGTATLKNSTFNLNYPDSDAESMANFFVSSNWGQGNMVNLSAMTLGNKSTGAYQYATNVAVENCQFNVLGEHAALFPTSYIYANSGDGIGVTLTYDANTTFNGGKGLIVGSTNVTINGAAASVNE